MFHCALCSGIHGSILRLRKSQKFVLTNSDLHHNLLDYNDDCGNVTTMFCAWEVLNEFWNLVFEVYCSEILRLCEQVEFWQRIEFLQVLLGWQSNQSYRKQMHNRFQWETRHMTNTWPAGKIVVLRYFTCIYNYYNRSINGLRRQSIIFI